MWHRIAVEYQHKAIIAQQASASRGISVWRGVIAWRNKKSWHRNGSVIDAAWHISEIGEK